MKRKQFAQESKEELEYEEPEELDFDLAQFRSKKEEEEAEAVGAKLSTKMIDLIDKKVNGVEVEPFRLTREERQQIKLSELKNNQERSSIMAFKARSVLRQALQDYVKAAILNGRFRLALSDCEAEDDADEHPPE